MTLTIRLLYKIYGVCPTPVHLNNGAMAVFGLPHTAEQYILLHIIQHSDASANAHIHTNSASENHALSTPAVIKQHGLTQTASFAF